MELAAQTETDREAVLWEVDGLPRRLVWLGMRWRVIDTPTYLREEVESLPPMITHAPQPVMGWRFTARSDVDGTVLTFDLSRENDRWLVARTWG